MGGEEIGEEDFYRALGDRTVQYGERPLDPKRRVVIRPSPEFVGRKEGQVAVLVAAGLLCRMVRRVGLEFGDCQLHHSFGGPMTGSLRAFALERMRALSPFGEFSTDPSSGDDYVLQLGRWDFGWLADGADWNAYIGPAPSPLPIAATENIFGAALATTAAVANIFGLSFPSTMDARVSNVLDLTAAPARSVEYAAAGTELGNLWFVGAGSVGSSVAYFLALAGLRFEASLFDMDEVKIENLDRSPIFEFEDRTRPKVDVVAAFLRSFGLAATPEPRALDESSLWLDRPVGVPDVIIAAANEKNVRFEIESQFPPIQIYGTTGRSWQSNVFRHVPAADPCSCCCFPPKTSVTECATGSAPSPLEAGKQVDAALPFLSFAAGILAAAEVSKLVLSGFPFSSTRGYFTPLGAEMLYVRAPAHRSGCVCETRSPSVHKQVLAGTRYQDLCRF